MSREMSMYTSPSQVSAVELTMGSESVNLSPGYTRQKQMSSILTHPPQVEQDSRTPKTPSPPQSPALVLGTLDYTKMEDEVYYTEKKLKMQYILILWVEYRCCRTHLRSVTQSSFTDREFEK